MVFQEGLRADLQFVCKRCKGEITDNAVFPASVMYSGGSLEVVENFCYLGDMLGSEGREVSLLG